MQLLRSPLPLMEEFQGVSLPRQLVKEQQLSMELQEKQQCQIHWLVSLR